MTVLFCRCYCFLLYTYICFFFFFFFFQAEDGIRDGTVTGVQTCALPICRSFGCVDRCRRVSRFFQTYGIQRRGKLRDRKSTRLNSSHSSISYAVFCLKKKRTGKDAAGPTFLRRIITSIVPSLQRADRTSS